MAEELGKIERPEAGQFHGKRKLYVVPLLFSWKDNPKEYADKLALYWRQAREHVANLESRIGEVKIVYHESVTSAGDEGLAILERLNADSYHLVREKCLMGARLEVIEDTELIEETMDWERHLIIGFMSNKAARVASQNYAEASKKRYEHLSQRIKDTLKEGEVGMIIIREDHQVQFPSDVEVFMVAPPALNDVHRWLRERQERPDEEAPVASEEAPAPAPTNEPPDAEEKAESPNTPPQTDQADGSAG